MKAEQLSDYLIKRLTTREIKEIEDAAELEAKGLHSSKHDIYKTLAKNIPKEIFENKGNNFSYKS